jgi:hypothetical protein
MTDFHPATIHAQSCLDDKIEQKRNCHKMKTGAKFCIEQSQPELALKTKTWLATDAGRRVNHKPRAQTSRAQTEQGRAASSRSNQRTNPCARRTHEQETRSDARTKRKVTVGEEIQGAAHQPEPRKLGASQRGLNWAQKNHRGKTRTEMQSHEEQHTFLDLAQAWSEKHTSQTKCEKRFFHCNSKHENNRSNEVTTLAPSYDYWNLKWVHSTLSNLEMKMTIGEVAMSLIPLGFYL